MSGERRAKASHSWSARILGRCAGSVSARVVLIALPVLAVAWAGYWVVQSAAGRAAVDRDWPLYMNDSLRSGSTSGSLGVPLQQQWVYEATAPPEPAWADPHPFPVENVLEVPKVKFDDAYHVVAADGAVYFGTADNRVRCLDARTGRERWAFFTDGPVRLAPSLHGGRVYFGADDGHAYCLDAADGRLVWKVSAGPADERLLGSGRMISRWPVRTSVLVHDDTAYFAGGIFPGERVYLHAVRAEDGAPVWVNDTISDRNAGSDGFSPQGYLLANDDYLFAPSGRALPAAFERATGRYMYQKGYSRWTYGPLGGSWAMLASNELYAGGEPVYGYDQRSGNIGVAWFPEGRQVVVTPDRAYLLAREEVIALDRAAYPAATWQQRQLSERRAALMKAKPDDLEDQLKKLEEEENKNEADRQAASFWRQEAEALHTIIATPELVLAGGEGEVLALDAETGRRVWRAPVEGVARGLAVAEDRLLVSTDTGRIYSFGNGEPPPAAQAAAPQAQFPGQADAAIYEAAAETILNQTGIREGYCLVLGAPTGRLAHELAKRSELNIYVVDADAARVQAAREAFDAAGLYGTRVTVDRGDPANIPYSDYFANLVVSEEALVEGALSTPPHEVYRMLKPCGGVMLLGQPAQAPAAARRLTPERIRRWFGTGPHEALSVSTEGGTWGRLDRAELPGSGWWTHQYGDAGNTASSTDTALEGALGLLWYGEPGPDKVPSRHARNVAPLVVNGRVYLQGINRVICFDAYNGLIHWEREIDGAYRVGASHDASNIAADERGIFVATGPRCLLLDAVTGETVATFDTPAYADGESRRWSWIALDGRMLYGSAGTGARNSNKIFAYDTRSGELAWEHDGTEIWNNGIALHDGGIFFADKRADAAQRREALGERIEQLRAEKGLDEAAALQELAGADVQIAVALDAATGRVLWERPVDLTDCTGVGPGGGALITMAADGVVVFAGAHFDGHYWAQFLGNEYQRRRAVVLSAQDGSLKWAKAVGCRIRPLIVGDTLYAEPWAFDLHTGEQKTRQHPLTGRETVWELERPGHHCGTISGTPKGLFFRSNFYGYYDLVADHGTEHFAGIRPGCWINQIPAGGLMVAPEASSGCVCLISIHTTTVLAPRAQRKGWGLYTSRGDAMPVRNLRVNLGAPGDRADSWGNVWLGYPRPWGRMRMPLDLTVDIAPDLGYFSEPAETMQVAGTHDPWLYASGCAGLQRCVVPLMGSGDGRALYTVRLGFAAPEGDEPGARMFGIKLQGETVVENLDIAAAAGGVGRAVVMQYEGVEVADNLVVELVAGPGEPDKRTAPLLNTIEVIRERVLEIGLTAPSFSLSDLDQAPARADLLLANRTDQAFTGTLQVVAPEAFSITAQEAQVTMAPDTRLAVQLSARVATRGQPGSFTGEVRLLRDDGTVAARRPVTIEYLGDRKRVVIPASEDTYVSAGSPTTDFSKRHDLLVDGGDRAMGDHSHNVGYLKFPLDVPGRVVSVVLRMRTGASGHPQSVDSGRVHLVEESWSAAAVRYAARPRPGKEIGNLGAVGFDEWVERPLDIDLTGRTELSLVLEPTHLDGASYLSSESGQGPELVIEYVAGP